MTVLVTGAAGFIGSHTVDTLLSQQCSVVGLDNFASGRLQNLEQARQSAYFTFIEGDMTDERFMSELLARYGITEIIHLAGMVGVAQSIKHPKENHRLNVLAVETMARLAAGYKCRRFTFASSAAVYGTPEELPLIEGRSICTPISPYGAAKLEAEGILKRYQQTQGLDCVVLRYFNVYGPRQEPQSEYSGVISRFCAQAAAREPFIVYGDGLQTRDFIYVGDVARMNAAITTSSMPIAGPLNVATGMETSIHDLVTVVRRHLGAKSTMQREPPRPADIRRSFGDTTRLRATGLISEFTPLDAGLRRTIDSLSRACC